MDLYEALKEGATEEELLAAFKKDLAEAADKLNAENEEFERLEELDDARWDLAEALLVYMDLLFNDGSFDNVTDSDVYDALYDLEDMNYLQTLCGVFSKMDESKEEEKPSAAKSEDKADHCDDSNDDANDWKIIMSFINSL
jgi:hypothetical protein